MSERTSTIRATTQDERDNLAEARQKRYRYVIVNPVNDNYWLSFGVIVNGGQSKAEAVFWAERLWSKSEIRYIPPEGWDGIKGELPDD